MYIFHVSMKVDKHSLCVLVYVYVCVPEHTYHLPYIRLLLDAFKMGFDVSCELKHTLT